MTRIRHYTRVLNVKTLFTSSFIALNFILFHEQMMKSNKVTLFLQIGYDFSAKKELPRLTLLFVEKSLILSRNPIWRRLELNVCFMMIYCFRKLRMLESILNQRIDWMISILSSLLQTKSTNDRKVNGT